MIAYLFLNAILLIKLLLFILIKIFFIPNILSKYFLVIIFILILFLCYKYPYNNILIKKDLFEYALKTRKAHIFNMIIIFVYSSIFVIGIFYLRFLNTKKKIDLNFYCTKINKLFLDFTWHENIINILLIILFIIIYITLMYKLTQYFKFHIIKRHIYLLVAPLNINKYVTFHVNLYPYNANTIPGDFARFLSDLYDKYYLKLKKENILDNKNIITGFDLILKYKINQILYHILTKWHHLLLLLIIIYDIFYNDYIIQHIFPILPWFFIYELYIRISHFTHGLWIPYDQALHALVYCKQFNIINDDTILIDGEFYDYFYYTNMYKYYIMRGFIKDPEHI